MGASRTSKLFAYTNNEYRLSAPLTGVFGIRVDNSDFTPAELSGNAGFVYRPRLTHTIRFLAGISLFDPAHKIAFIYTGHLRPARHMLREKNRSAEVGYQGRLGERVKVEGVVYRIIGYDHVELGPVQNGVRRGINRPLHSAIWGAETALDVLITRQVSLWANYTVAKPTRLRTANPLDPSWPRNLANGGVKALVGKSLAHVWLNYTDRVIPGGGRPSPVPAYTMVNATFNYDVSDRVGVFFTGYNLGILRRSDIQLRDKRAELTLFVCALKGFAEAVEEIEPEELIHILNAYLTAMTDVIFKHEGTLDKFRFGSIFGFFGDPIAQEDHPIRAVRMAIEIRMAVLQAILAEQVTAISRFNPDTAGELERIVSKTLEKTADDRYQSAKDMLVDLKKVRRGYSTSEAGSGRLREHE